MSGTPPSASVRDMTPADQDAARALMAQLGYDLDAGEFARRFDAVMASGGDHSLTVAEQGGAVLGLLHVFARPALEKPTEALVQSLVVDRAARGMGVGRALMAWAEAWAQSRGLGSVALHTQDMRSDARAFYGTLGYEEITQSMLLRKKLD